MLVEGRKCAKHRKEDERNHTAGQSRLVSLVVPQAT